MAIPFLPASIACDSVELSPESSRIDLGAVRDAAIVISVATGVAVELTLLKGTLLDFFGDAYPWATALSILIAVVLVGWIVVWPRYTRWTRRRRLDVVAAQSKVLIPGYFFLKPLSAADAERFVRLDKVHGLAEGGDRSNCVRHRHVWCRKELAAECQSAAGHRRYASGGDFGAR